MPSEAEGGKEDRTASRRQPELESVREGRWESSWVPLGPDHMCPQGVYWRTVGAGGSREGSREEVLRAMGLDPVKLY